MMHRPIAAACFTLAMIGLLTAGTVEAQRQLRRHTATSAGPLTLLPATEAPIAPNEISIQVVGGIRHIGSNSIAAHFTGAFPNADNPNRIAPQAFEADLPASPSLAGAPTFYDLGTFGVAVNGVIIEPQAAEWFLGERSGGWQYDPLGAAIPLGLDANHAHVQPDGTYHYHGLPTGLLEGLGVEPGTASPLIGWAMDGFPVFALYAEFGGAVRQVTSSYRLKEGTRPSGGDQPGGPHDGAFLADWAYIEGAGDLDACNGMMLETAEFPDGTYAYFLTTGYPVVPRCFAGTPISQALAPGAPPAGGQANQRAGGHRLAGAAAALGVSVEDLEQAIGPPPPDTARAARMLGLDETLIRRALRDNRP